MNFEKKLYTFATRATIGKDSGLVHIEPITNKIKSCPEATHRVVARYVGKIKRGTPIDIDGRGFIIRRMFAGPKTSLTHFFCESVEAVTA